MFHRLAMVDYFSCVLGLLRCYRVCANSGFSYAECIEGYAGVLVIAQFGCLLGEVTTRITKTVL